MGDRHGGCFARRGRALNPPRPQVDAHREVGFRWRATAFRCRGVVGRICPAREGSPQQKPPDTARRRKEFVPRRNTPLDEGLPTRREGERICPAQECSPRRRHPDTALEQKNLPRAGTRPSAKASRHGARAKEFARAGTRPSAKVSRHGARAKGFVPRGFAFAPRADERRAALGPQTAEKHPFGGVAPEMARPLPSSFT